MLLPTVTQVPPGAEAPGASYKGADVLYEVSSGQALFVSPMLERQTGVVQEVTTPRTKVCPNINATQPHHPH